MDKTLIVKICIILYGLSSVPFDLLTSFRFDWRHIPFLHNFLTKTVGMWKYGNYKLLPIWQQSAGIMASMFVFPVFIIIFLNVHDLSPLLKNFGIIAASMLLMAEGQQWASFASHPLDTAWVGYASGILHSFVALYLIYFLSDESISGIFMGLMAFIIVLFPWILVKITRDCIVEPCPHD